MSAAPPSPDIARHLRLMELARHNGWPVETCEFDGGVWWRVPAGFGAIAGCMMALIKERGA